MKDHIKEDEMGRPCSMHGEVIKAYTFYMENPKGGDYERDLCVYCE
jgi:hypothetical protein